MPQLPVVHRPLTSYDYPAIARNACRFAWRKWALDPWRWVIARRWWVRYYVTRHLAAWGGFLLVLVLHVPLVIVLALLLPAAGIEWLMRRGQA
jgi:hypothetical protein